MTGIKPIKAKSKYGNHRTYYMGITFDSKKEFERYLLLRDMEKSGKITNLQCQVPYQLIETFKHKGQTVLGVKYIADFVYDREGETIVEDVKSAITAQKPSYIIKKKLLLKLNPDINFVEVF